MIITFRFISDEEDDFVLDVNIKHDQTFLELHEAIQKQLDFDPTQLASFVKSNEEWEKLDEIALMDMGEDTQVHIMAETKIEYFISQKNERILYIYDFFEERLFFGSITRIIDQESPIPLPSVSRYEGIVPMQFQEEPTFDHSLSDNSLDEGIDEDEEDDEDIIFESLDDLSDMEY